MLPVAHAKLHQSGLRDATIRLCTPFIPHAWLPHGVLQDLETVGMAPDVLAKAVAAQKQPAAAHAQPPTHPAGVAETSPQGGEQSQCRPWHSMDLALLQPLMPSTRESDSR